MLHQLITRLKIVLTIAFHQAYKRHMNFRQHRFEYLQVAPSAADLCCNFQHVLW